MTPPLSLLALSLLQPPETVATNDAPASAPRAVPAPSSPRSGSSWTRASPAPCALPTPPSPPRRGTTLLITGAVLTFPIAMPMVTLGALRMSNGYSSSTVDPILPIGLLGFGAGVAMLTVGALRYSAWKDWQRKYGVSLRVQLGRSNGAWTPGLVLRF